MLPQPRSRPRCSNARTSDGQRHRDKASAAVHSSRGGTAMRVLVTGAGSGIGRATCLRLARDGKAQGTPAKIAAVDVASSAGLDGVVKELISLGAEAIAVHGDMATADAPGTVVA